MNINVCSIDSETCVPIKDERIKTAPRDLSFITGVGMGVEIRGIQKLIINHVNTAVTIQTFT